MLKKSFQIKYFTDKKLGKKNLLWDFYSILWLSWSVAQYLQNIVNVAMYIN